VTTENVSTHQTLMMMTVMVIETSVQYEHLMRMLAREDYIKFTLREITKIYINSLQCIFRTTSA